MRRSCTLKLDFHIQCASVLSDKSTSTRASVGDISKIKVGTTIKSQTVESCRPGQTEHKNLLHFVNRCWARMYSIRAFISIRSVALIHQFTNCNFHIATACVLYKSRTIALFYDLCTQLQCLSAFAFLHFHPSFTVVPRGFIYPCTHTKSIHFRGIRGHFYIPFHFGAIEIVPHTQNTHGLKITNDIIPYLPHHVMNHLPVDMSILGLH